MVVVVIIAILHGLMVSFGYTNFLYERFRDVLILLLSFGLCVFSIVMIKKEGKNFTPYLVIANCFLLIFVIHLLRFIYGGLMC